MSYYDEVDYALATLKDEEENGTINPRLYDIEINKIIKDLENATNREIGAMKWISARIYQRFKIYDKEE